MPWLEILGTTPWEIIATLAAIAGVVLIARQNALGWPLGILWAIISAWLAYSEWHLISDAILYASYVPIQTYCWVTWHRAAKQHKPFHPSWLSKKSRVILLSAVIATIGIWGFGITIMSENLSWLPAPALLWRDATSTVLNYFAQFLQARKRMENWLGWIVVNLLGIHIYWIQGSTVYAIQYTFFLALGLYGWWSWQQAIKQAKS